MHGPSSVPVGDAAAGEVVGGELDLDAITRQDADVVLAHLPGDGREHCVAAVDLDPEHRARERLDDLALHLDFLFLDRHLPHNERRRTGAASSTDNETAQLNGCAVSAHRSKTGAAVRIRGPASVTATVCSKWAESDPSAVEIDQSSSWT